MSKNDLQNEKFDRIARDLLKTAKAKDDEIEKIVTAPHLFAAIEAKIQAEKLNRRRQSQSFGSWTSWLDFLQRQKVFAIATVLFALVGSFVFFITSYRTENVATIAQNPEPKKAAEIEFKSNAPEISNEKRRFETASDAENADLKITEKRNSALSKSSSAAVKTRKSAERQRKESAPKTPAKTASSSPPEVFYSLSIGGSWESTNEDLQIVRTELSRAELFALGVNLPDEIEKSKIKTDLLVSANGVPRAIKFVE